MNMAGFGATVALLALDVFAAQFDIVQLCIQLKVPYSII